MAVQSGQPTAPMPTGDRTGVWERAWDFLTSSRCAAVLLLLTAFVLFLAGIFPQAPASGNDTTAQLRWLAEATARWGASGPTLRALGLFHIATSPLWRILLALGVFVLLVNAAQELWRALRYARSDTAGLPTWAQGQRLADGDAAQAIAALESVLRQAGYRTRTEPVGDTLRLHAVRAGWAAWLRFGTAVGLLLVAGALLLSGIASRSEYAALGPGENAAVSLRPGWSVALADGAQGAGWPVVLIGPEAELRAQGIIGPQRPLWAGPLTLHMTHTFAGVVVSATDAQGAPVPLQAAGESSAVGTLFLRFDEDQPEQYFAAPSVGDTIRVALDAAAGGGATTFAFQIFHGMDIQPSREGAFSAEAATTSDGITYRFTAGRYPAVLVIRDPSRYPLWLGTVIAIVCLIASAWARARAAFVQVVQFQRRAAVTYLASDAETEAVIRRAL